MRALTFILFCFSSTLLFSQSSLVIIVNGLKKPMGELYIGLYNSDSTFKKTELVYHKLIITVDSLNVMTTIDSLPIGQYALTLFHDENANGKLDKKFYGPPKEPYGFSNNPKVRFKTPSFEKCAFDVNGNTEVKINMK